MKWLFRLLEKTELAWAILSILVLGLVLLVRAAGIFQSPELGLYDMLLRQGVDRSFREDRIVVCGMTESDLEKYGHPLEDEKLASLLEKLVLANPCVIGLDLYRDLKEPRNGQFYPKLEKVLQEQDRIIGIEKLGKIKPPPQATTCPSWWRSGAALCCATTCG